MADQFLDHKVDNAIAPSSLKALLDANAAIGWQMLKVVATGSTFTVISQRRGVSTYSTS